MDIKPDSDSLMIALAYGKESHYKIENGTFVMLPVQYTKQGDTLFDDDGEAVNAVLNPDTNIWTVTEESDKDITVRYAKADDDNYYYLYADESCTGGKIAYKKTSISDLKGESASDIIYNIQLGTVLDISPLDKYDAEKEAPDSLMLSLAYGEETLTTESKRMRKASIISNGSPTPRRAKIRAPHHQRFTERKDHRRSAALLRTRSFSARPRRG